jgi:hypothetical protein
MKRTIRAALAKRVYETALFSLKLQRRCILVVDCYCSAKCKLGELSA